MNQSALRPRAETLLQNSALRDVCRWRLPNSDGDNVAADDVTFAKDHGQGFFRAAQAAVGQIKAKTTI